MPDFSFEQKYAGHVCGLDEVGRAPLAGPVVAACVYIPVDNYDNPLWSQVNDSKKISAKKRVQLTEQIKEHSHWGISEASPEEVDQLNNIQASFLAMRRAFEQIMHKIDHALIDGNLTPKSFPCPATPIVKGDTKSASIAAASIIAKVYRDNLMANLAKTHPHYGWERNVGYPTKEHQTAIDNYGITPHHRKSFAPVKNFLEFGTTQRQLKMAI